MAWCPFAIHKPLSENHTQGSITPRAVILHTAVSSSSSLFDFFQNNSDLESHFYVRDDGVIEQYMDTGRRADANKNANDFAVSIESQDGAKIVPWTQAQVDAIVRLADWLCSTHGIPRRQIPDAYGSGIGWHVQFGAPGPWTPVSKSCPGGPRIDQTKNVIIPRVAARQIEGEDLNQAQNDALAAVYNVIANPAGTGYGTSNLAKQLGYVVQRVEAVGAKVDELESKVVSPAPVNVDVAQLAAALEPTIAKAVADEVARRLAD